MTDVISSFRIINLIKIAPLTMIQALGYICGILAVKYVNVSTVAPIMKQINLELKDGFVLFNGISGFLNKLY